MLSLVKTILNFKTKEEAVKFHLLAISAEEGLNLSTGDICVATEIYLNGYNKDIIKSCVDKGYFKSEQTVMNSISKMTKTGILIKPKRGIREVNSKILPSKNDSDFLFLYQIKYNK